MMLIQLFRPFFFFPLFTLAQDDYDKGLNGKKVPCDKNGWVCPDGDDTKTAFKYFSEKKNFDEASTYCKTNIGCSHCSLATVNNGKVNDAIHKSLHDDAYISANDKVEEGNCLADITAEGIEITHEAGGYSIVENGVRSYIWEYPRLNVAFDRIDAAEVVTCYCAWPLTLGGDNAPWQKATRLKRYIT